VPSWWRRKKEKHDNGRKDWAGFERGKKVVRFTEKNGKKKGGFCILFFHRTGGKQESIGVGLKEQGKNPKRGRERGESLCICSVERERKEGVMSS